MKRQRNTTQMKEEEIGKLPEKESRIMIVKMIKNLENKMEKMQGSINKDLEELNNRQRQTTQLLKFKNILERINNRISEAEEQISELENKMVERTSEDQNKVKRMKRTQRPLGQYQIYQHLNYRGPRRRREKDKI